ncbi:iron ABC transporter ATP-binding protein [Vibrio salinus]|uniref:iron ABC transporter ATP-binding protein n=1 Tax=Vibrio salinus TaxID=2899784 RepID=UPI001E3C7C64|nr:ATP-binding cassette domain-containing protein [Vibrio salinus]MCE0496065.1 ATP-binding cassette domain-containing protein [Vibrio salinus]
MISVLNLTKQFDRQTVVDNATVYFEKGEITSIIGPNGAGKSTLLSMACRLLNKDKGEVWIDGKELVEWDTKALAKKLSVLRQSNSLSMRFTVRELVSFGRFPYSKGGLTAEDVQIVDRSLAYLKIDDIQDKFLDQLSGGQRQLAFIAMVIAQDTDYIFLDEPLNNLDIRHSLQIMKTIKRLAHELGKAVIIVIHDINFASCYSDSIVALKKGQVVVSGKVDEVIDSIILSEIYETPFNVIEHDGKKMCLYYA